MNKKLIAFTAVIFSLCGLFAEPLAKEVAVEASKKESLEESIEYLKTEAEKISVQSERRGVYIFLASLQEQMALYSDAQKNYAKAAAIAGTNAEGMQKKTNEQLVLDAVRCALSAGDYETADLYLNSAVRNSKSNEIQAYIKLYEQWSALCKANKVSDLQEPVLMLQAYSKAESMKSVRAAILLTLWYVTGENSYAVEIRKFFPESVEAAIVNGEAQLLPTPFWFFVPKSGEAESETGIASEKNEPEAKISVANADLSKVDSKTTKYQLGLFRTEANAKALADELNLKNFKAYVTTETRSSGTTYYIVLVDDDGKGNLDDRLRSFGYECYAVD